MTDSERILRRIEVLLQAIAERLGVTIEQAKKQPSAASVSSVTKMLDGTVTDNDSDVPRQVVNETRRVGPMGKARRVTFIK